MIGDKGITYKLGNYKGWIEQSANSGLPMQIPMSSVQFSSVKFTWFDGLFGMLHLQYRLSVQVLGPLIGDGNDITSS